MKRRCKQQQLEDLSYSRKTIMVESVQLGAKRPKLSSRPLIVALTVLFVVLQLTVEVVICKNNKNKREVAFKLQTAASRSGLRNDFRQVHNDQSDADDASKPYKDMLASQGELPEPLALGVPIGERPKLIPLVAAESGYNENSSVNILCTVSSGHHESLIFDWFKDNQPITDSMSINNNLNSNSNNLPLMLTKPIQVDKHADHSLLRISQVQAWHSGRYTCSAKNQFGSDSSSVTLRVNVKLHWTREPPREIMVSANQELKLDCLAHGEPKPLIRWEKVQQSDSSSSFSHQHQKPSGNANGLKISANSASAPSSFGAHQTAAAAAPKNGQVSSVLVSSGRYLNIARARETDSGLYECIAINGNDADLRKIVHVQVRAPASFDQRFVVIQAKLGDTVRLDCNATGDQPLQVNWFREGSNESLEKHGNSQYDIHESLLGFEGQAGLSSALEMRQLRQEDAQLYKCQGKNEYGSSERLIKLIVLDAPEKPSGLRIRDIWSRSALISWQAAQSGTSRVTNFTVQYWRKSVSPNNLMVATSAMANSAGQNHRRESLTVDGLQTSALIVNLMPALSYEISVISHNQVGQSEPSDPINITTSDEEPSAPPSDVLVEPKGSTSLRVAWKVPPLESHNGRLIGFYVGYRPKVSQHQANLLASSVVANSVISSNSLVVAMQQQQQQQQQQNNNINPNIMQQQQQLQQPVFSYKTAEAVDGQLFYDIFLTYLKPATDYEITVRATNKAGSGPDCHTIGSRTNGYRLPPAPTLQVHKINFNSVQLKWLMSGSIASPTTNSLATNHNGNGMMQQSSSKQIGEFNPATTPTFMGKFVLFYQQLGERDWYDLAIDSTATLNTGSQQSSRFGQSSAFMMPESMLMQDLGGFQMGANVNEDAYAQSSAQQAASASSELIGAQSNLHTLSNLKPNQQYRIYVAAMNEYGIGDPSNVVVIKTEPLSNNAITTAAAAASANGLLGQQQPVLLEGLVSAVSSTSTGGFFSNFWAPSQQQPTLINGQQHYVFTNLTSLILICILVTLIGYLIWQKHFKNKYHSSSASSYPSSWTQATGSDTFQSEYSIKRLPFNQLPQQQSHQQHQQQCQPIARQQLEVQDATMHIATRIANGNTNTNSNTNNTNNTNNRRDLIRGLNHSGLLAGTQTTRPMIANPIINHYHQPADLMSGTMQLGNRGSRNKSHLYMSQQNQAITSSTLNRNHQNRQLPPIPYSTLSVKEIQSTVPSKGWRAIPTANLQSSTNNQIVAIDQHHLQQQQQQQLQQQSSSQAIGSQSPLIYGVIE